MKKNEKTMETDALSVLMQDALPCSVEEGMKLKEHYMNHYGHYMAGNIGISLSSMLLITIMLATGGLSFMWEWFKYGEVIVYGSVWLGFCLYLAVMMTVVVRRTYDLKMAILDGRVKKTRMSVQFKSFEGEKKKRMLVVYVKMRRKNELLEIPVHKKRHRGMNFEMNLVANEKPGPELTVYFVDDKRHDVFFLVNGRKTQDVRTIRKALKEDADWKIARVKGRWYSMKQKIKRKK